MPTHHGVGKRNRKTLTASAQPQPFSPPSSSRGHCSEVENCGKFKDSQGRSRFDNYLDKGADLEKQWCWIFNNLSTFVNRPEYLDSSFDEVISDAGTGRLSMEEKLKYMEAVHLNERERIVVHQGGYILGKEEGLAEGRNEGRAEGRAEGRNEERIKNAKAMLAKQYPVSDIAEITGLSEAEIRSLE